ncbi:uncharacterized protein LOC111711723 isoform X2 [Eurytemora carolleeae]|nr:uncharacterized protein LOC111711723 isoform X2 [Eurytemora carolleeae]|eukprot:XP_023341914.1 uncharacterized protein LOC111711723 isoform X2 [Eurytemora affinis]
MFLIVHCFLFLNILHSTQAEVETVQSAAEETNEDPAFDVGFGVAKHFMPLPNTVVGSHCAWKLRLNSVPNRIPETITEILCRSADTNCGGSHFYGCRQMKSKILVGYTEHYGNEQFSRLRTMRNVTFNIGCSCVYRSPVFLENISSGPMEKRGGRRNNRNQLALQEYPLSRHEMKRGGSKVQKAPRVQQVQRGYEVQSVQEVQRGYDIPTVQQVQRGYEVPRVQEVQRGYVVPSVQEVQIGYEVPRVLEVQRGYEVPRVQEVQLMYPFISSVETEPSRA